MIQRGSTAFHVARWLLLAVAAFLGIAIGLVAFPDTEALGAVVLGTAMGYTAWDVTDALTTAPNDRDVRDHLPHWRVLLDLALLLALLTAWYVAVDLAYPEWATIWNALAAVALAVVCKYQQERLAPLPGGGR